MPGTLDSAASIATRDLLDVRQVRAEILMPIGVRMPVESMSSRPLIGMVQALEMPGSWSAASISRSQLGLGDPVVARTAGGPPSATPAPSPSTSAGFSRHCDAGLSITVVSIIESGAGSVEVLARPALPNTRSTSGKVGAACLCSWSAVWASATDIPGCTAEGM